MSRPEKSEGEIRFYARTDETTDYPGGRWAFLGTICGWFKMQRSDVYEGSGSLPHARRALNPLTIRSGESIGH
jgi:hypothetical protein